LHRDEARLQPEIYPGAAVMRARGNQPGISPWLFVMATALNTMVAAVLAVIITLGVVRQDRADTPPRESAPMAAAYAKTVGSGGVPTQLVAMGYTVDLRPIGSPDQPLRLAPRQPARLPLQIQPDDAAREPFILVLAGAPPGTTLSGATRIGSDTWFLPPGAASMLEITVPEWSTAPFEVVMELRRMNGAAAAQAKAWIAVPPPATPEAAWAKADDSAAKELMTRADLLLEQGNVIAARTVYQRAAEMGSGPAALTLGSTYDPNRLWSIGALGMVGNKERAKQWYARAAELGHPDAGARLKLLGN